MTPEVVEGIVQCVGGICISAVLITLILAAFKDNRKGGPR